MLPVGPVGSVPLEKCGLGPDPVGRGMPLLRRVPGRDSHTPEWKAGHRQRNLRKAAQAIGRFCRKTVRGLQDASPKDTSFSAKLEELRKVFLTRPDCPRFSTRATSVCQCGSAISDKLPEELHAALASWEVSRDPFSSQRVDGCPLPLSKSACEFSSLWRKSDSGPVSPALSSPVLARSPLRKRVPWYVSIIHEKVRSHPPGAAATPGALVPDRSAVRAGPRTRPRLAPSSLPWLPRTRGFLNPVAPVPLPPAGGG
uniref:Uncharacterized protein n=1 Tax=Suricata suricatta TaxID=37032 RepID=A0A673TTD2_SURSU